MDGALDVLKQLGAILADVGGIVRSVFRAMESSGKGALGIVGSLLDGLHDFLDSVRGQDILKTVFAALGDVGKALLPIIKAVAGAIGEIAPEVAKLATAFGPVLTTAINALAPAVAALAPGIIAVISGIGEAVSALAPALLPLGQALGQAFGTLRPLFAGIGEAIAALLPGIQTFITAFSQGMALLAPALAPLGAAIGGIFAALAPLLPLVGELAALFATSLASGLQTILPSLRLLVENFGETLRNLAPIIPLFFEFAASIINALVPALAPLLPQIANLITQLVSGLVPALTPLIPIIADIVGIVGQTFVEVLGVLIGKIIEILPPLSEMAQLLGMALLQALEDIAPHLPALLDALLAWLPAMVNLLPSLTSLAVSLMPRFFDSLDKILPLLPDLITAMINLNQVMYPLIPIFADLLKQMAPYIPLFIELAAVIAEQLIPPLTRFLEVVTKTVGGVLKQFSDLYDKLVGHSIIPDLINGINDWVGRLPGMFSKWVGQAKDWAIAKFNELVGWISGLPGRIVSALGNLGGLLGGVGRDLIVGFWNGLVGMWQWLRDSIYNFFSSIMPQWVKDALGIASPSKLFAAIGEQLPPGLVLGIDHRMPMVEAASQRMAEATVGAFDGLASPAPAFSGTFGAAGGTGAAPAGSPVNMYGDLHLHLQGILDPSDPISVRNLGVQIRDVLIDLEREAYPA
jgi:phage-related protein